MTSQRVVLAEYFCADDKTLLFIIRSDFEEPRVIELLMPLEQLRAFVLAYIGTSAGDNRVPELDEAVYQTTFGPFVEPLRDWTDEGDIVWLVPHDALHYLPLHALQLDSKPLIERNPVCYSPSASVMKYCHEKRKGRRKTALVLGDSRSNSPPARDEAAVIADLFQSTLYVRGDATKSLIRKALAERGDDIDIIHFACHGVFDPIQPLRSGIELAPEGGELANTDTEDSWRLTAEEIFQLEMHADLVTISACDSGVSKRRPGDELIGLTRALIYAGTPSVVVSLWRVHSLAVQILMEHFYQALLNGAMKAVALQQAQIAIKHMRYADVIAYVERRYAIDIADDQGGLDPWLAVNLLALEESRPVDEADWRPFSHLYYWAPFVLVGDWF